jgi:hypothetical protein
MIGQVFADYSEAAATDDTAAASTLTGRQASA